MTDVRSLLGGLVGSWVGTYRLWIEPEVLHGTCETTATARPVLGGRFVELAYTWSVDGDAQEGLMLIGAPRGDLVLSWVDSWHNGDDLMQCVPAGPASVFGHYGPPDERWGWRTSLEQPRADELVIRAWNVTPAGVEALATEADYHRV